ncbi:MAG: hypothetical protein IGS38_22500 [Synechococcales cyanobacterium M58_A2018_015]|nr:hypothetical protein [Synechococcales cyanobacterium M58_A2018_015]
MLSQIFYLIRSRADGQYLVARPRGQSAAKGRDDQPADPGYLLMFQEHSDALSYLNAHGAQVADQFAVESIPSTQLKSVLKRWGFTGVGVVQDPLLPRIEFLQQE